MGAIAELPGDASVGVRPSRRWLRASAPRGLIDALVTQPPAATTTVLPRTITALALTTMVPPTMLPATSGAGTGGESARFSALKKLHAQFGYLKQSPEQSRGGACTGIFSFQQMGQSWRSMQ